ncbi:glycosyltransferase [Butyrivibrio fibrisolvens]|uniref:glycosyltransferase n=1 Tax=Butyrivibrio fibrisolvens TaxID=831 RepID=UPI0003B7B015|nr:glycosyltransferase [Butyrivibrio fibrisolvens]
MIEKKVSVIIATYNSEKVLGKTLQALRKQTYPQDKIEILIMDGMSNDSTRDIAQKYDCIIIDNPKIEQGNAKILGMQHAKGDFILFVDSDEVVENPEAIMNTVIAFEEQPDCKVAVCSGYKRPEDYPAISGYISDCGDPFSFFLYNFPKDYRFYESIIRKYYSVVCDNDKYLVFDCDINNHFPLIEGGCGGIMMRSEYFDNVIPDCRNNIAILYHSFYIMCGKGEHKTIFVKNTPLAHYSADKISRYFNKLKWRICNNIHFTEKGKEVFSGRQDFQKQGKFKKYIFIPYALSFVIPFIHSVPYAISRRNSAYLWHCVLAFYCAIEIIYNYILKLCHITPAFVAYGSRDKIKK